MDPRSNPRNTCRNLGVSVDAPLLTSIANETHLQSQQDLQQQNQHFTVQLNNRSSEMNNCLKEREPFCCQMSKLKDETSRLMWLLELKDKEIAAHCKKTDEIIASFETQISSLKRSLQMETVDTTQIQKNAVT